MDYWHRLNFALNTELLILPQLSHFVAFSQTLINPPTVKWDDTRRQEIHKIVILHWVTGQSWQLSSTIPISQGIWSCVVTLNVQAGTWTQSEIVGCQHSHGSSRFRAASWVLAHQGMFSFWPPVKSSFGAICSAEHQNQHSSAALFEKQAAFLSRAKPSWSTCMWRERPEIPIQGAEHCIFPYVHSHKQMSISFFLENCSSKLNMKQISCVDNFSLLGETGKVQVSALYDQKSYQRWQVVGTCPSQALNKAYLCWEIFLWTLFQSSRKQ